MARHILDRYDLTADGKIIVDIYAGRIEDLYNNYDKYTSYIKKELDKELVVYLIDSVREIGPADFIIQLRFIEHADTDLIPRIKQSIKNYFVYLTEREYRDFGRMLRTAFLFFTAGVLVMSVSVWVNLNIDKNNDVIRHVFAAGLTVAAWVALWEALATLLVNWIPLRRKIRIYRRIASAPIYYQKVDK